MKLLTYILLVLVSIFSAKLEAQSFWGFTSRGGAMDHGSIFKTNSAGTGHQLKYSFPESTGDSPFGDLLEASNGLMYGVASSGGANNQGILFEFNPANGAFLVRASFNGPVTGREPRGTLVEGPNGKLYGTTMLGGANNEGVLFEYDTISRVLTKKIDFNSAITGRDSDEGLLRASNGKLYGVNPQGGTNGAGTLYEYDIPSNTLVVKVHFFGTSTGSVPVGSLIQAPSGILYGCTLYGGTSGYGVLYSYDISLDTCIIRCSFNGSGTGRNPAGTPCLANDGKFYGTTSIGGANNVGTIWRWDPNGSLSSLMSFNTSSTGGFSGSAIIQASDGLLYGFTGFSLGTIFNYNISTGTFTSMAQMGANQEIGKNPFGAWIQSTNGKLYALTRDGGALDYGAIFSYDPASQEYKLQWTFVAAFQGLDPRMGPVGTGHGTLLGVNYAGGLYGGGTLFEFDTLANVVNVIMMFDGTVMGKHPEAPPVMASNGIFYGASSEGGLYNQGVIYSYNPVTGVTNKEIDFPWSQFGGPAMSLVQAVNGKLYGVRNSGGAFSNGVLYEYDMTNNTLAVKYNFNSLTGKSPYCTLINGSDGKLYGSTSVGGVNDEGVLFSYDVITDSLIVLAEFDQPLTGRYPMYHHLVEYAPGIFYGTCVQGGTGNTGTLFQYDLNLDTLVRIRSFPTSAGEGWYPHGGLTPAPSGALLGMQWTGGTGGDGTTYRFTPPTGFTTTVAFTGTNGGLPYNELYYCSSVPFILTHSGNATLCEHTTFTAYTSAYGGNITYQWYVNGVSINGATTAFLQIANISAAEAGMYTCIVNSGTGSDTTGNIQLQILPAPLITISATDTAVCPGDSVMLSVTGATNYIWNPNVTPNVYFVPAATTTYMVTGTGVNGCVGTDSLTVSVGCPGIDERPGEQVHIQVMPNPAADYLVITLAGMVTSADIMIFNSLGEEMHCQHTGNEELRIDIGNYPSGIYLIECIAGSQPSTVRFVKK